LGLLCPEASGWESSIFAEKFACILSPAQLQTTGNALTVRLKLTAASGGESSICKEKDICIRSLTPGQAPENAPDARLKLPAASGGESSICKEEKFYPLAYPGSSSGKCA
jgi:hypothetical protein